MGILDRLSPSAQFIEVIEWLDDSSDTMLYRFPVRDQEIKNGAQLIVRESQAAVFVHEGQIADVFGPGRYSVEGGNTPVLSKLGAWKHGFNSPIKSEVYFVNTKQFTDLKWGTSNPVMMRDAAQNPSGGAGLGAGLGAGFAVGNAMAGAMSDAMRRTSEAGTSASGGASVGTKCVKCGAELPAGSKFCRECGAPQAPAKCANCQHELKPGAKFCDECGTKVG